MFDCIEKGLRRLFKWYGRFIARYPWPFIIIPVCMGLALGIGVFTHFTTEKDIETLYGPERTYSRRNRLIIEDLFSSVRDENMLQRHRIRSTNWGRLIVTPETGDNVLETSTMEDVLRLHENVMNVSIQYDGDHFKYKDLCMKWKGKCHRNEILELINYRAE